MTSGVNETKLVVALSLIAMSLAILPAVSGQASQTPGGVHFAPAMTISTAPYPDGIVSGDFNNDGIQDLAVDERKTGIAVALGLGNGTFGPLLGTPVTTPSVIAAGNFDGQNLDLAVNDANGPEGAVLLGAGNGYFSGGWPISIPPSGAFGFAVGDFNGDGNQDLAVTNGGDKVFIYLGNGDGTFRPRRNYSTGGTGSFGIIAGDFNGDGVTDLAVLNTGGVKPNIAVLPGAGNGSFGAPIVFHFPSSTTLGNFAAGDFNGDHILDLAVVEFDRNGGDIGVLLLLGNGDGTFTAASRYGAGPGAFTISTGDFNGDGKVDLAVGDTTATYAGYVSILLGNGDGTFQPRVSFPTNGLYTGQMAVADFNGDGKPDIAIVNTDSSNIGILLNTTPFASKSAKSQR